MSVGYSAFLFIVTSNPSRFNSTSAINTALAGIIRLWGCFWGNRGFRWVNSKVSFRILAFPAVLPMVWTSEVSLLRNPSLSASSIATSDTSGRSSPSRSRLMPTSMSKSPVLSYRSLLFSVKSVFKMPKAAISSKKVRTPLFLVYILDL